MTTLRLLLAGAALTLASACDRAQPTNPSATAPTKAPAVADNSAVNERDRDGSTMTPLDQKENDADLALTQRIRKGVMAADGLSITAQNIKIISANGRVTLRGPVKSAEEKSRINAIATEVAGAANVDDQLEVK